MDYFIRRLVGGVGSTEEKSLYDFGDIPCLFLQFKSGNPDDVFYGTSQDTGSGWLDPDLTEYSIVNDELSNGIWLTFSFAIWDSIKKPGKWKLQNVWSQVNYTGEYGFPETDNYNADDITFIVKNEDGSLPYIPGKKIACVGDSSDHNGTIITSNQDGTLKVGNDIVAVQGAIHRCGNRLHRDSAITAVVVKSYHNGKLILTEEAVAGCGAKITPPDRKVYIE